jgi:AcrR family transcriptional regulator
VSQIESTFTSHPLLQITSADRLEVRARVLAAARQRFMRFSHEQTSLTDLARAASVPLDEVKRHFADIRAVLVALQRALDGGRPAYRRPQSALVKARLANSQRKEAERALGPVTAR